MKTNNYSIVGKYASPENAIFWLAIALFIKGLVILFLSYNLDLFNGSGLIGICNGDCPDYLHTAKNIAETGVFGKSNGIEVLPYAGRMPGYDIILAPLSAFLGELWVMNVAYLLQMLLSVISVYCLAKTAYLLFPSKNVFYLTFFIYSINSFVTFYDLFILTESFCVSALIISLYFFLLGNKKTYYYLLSGAFFTWAMLMRPYLLPIWAVLNLYLIYALFQKIYSPKTSFFKLLKLVYMFSMELILFNSVFIFTETIWITRNYSQFNKFIPVVTDVHGGLQEGRFLALMEFVQAWGGDMVSWNPVAEITLFYKMNQIKHLPSKYTSFEDLPDYVFTSTYNADSLKKLKAIYDEADNLEIPKSESMKADLEVTKLLRKYRNDFISEKPFYFYVVAPLRLLPKFLFHSGSYNISNQPFAEQNIFQKVMKLFYSALYYFTLLFGFAFIFYAFFCVVRQRQLFPLLGFQSLFYIVIAAIPLYIIALCPLVLRRIEYRYFITAYPYCTILACYMLNVCLNYIFKLKSSGIE